MTRAAPLPPAQRREAIMDAVLPLVLADGRAVSTRQIATASGIAEGTIFRVFESKSALIDQVIHRALAPGRAVEELEALPDHDDLRALVVDIVQTLQDHARIAHRLFGLLPAASQSDKHHGPDESSRRELGEQLAAAISARLADHVDALGVSPRAAAGSLLALSFGSTFAVPMPDPADIADIILYGITRTDLEA